MFSLRGLISKVLPSSHTEANQIAGFRQSLHQGSPFNERYIGSALKPDAMM